jgi:nickel-type superoxide dismutase maturation protease
MRLRRFTESSGARRVGKLLGFVRVESVTKVRVVIHGNSMWPTFVDGDVLIGEQYDSGPLKLRDVVVVKHPLNPRVTVVKRLAEFLPDGRLFLEGDNPDPTASEDSHSFGPINSDAIIATISH